MEEATRNRFRKQIEEAIAELREQLEEGKDATAAVQLDTSIGRLSRMDAIQSQQMALALKQRQREQLQRLERALERIEAGTFGQCRKCRESIGRERLEAQLDAMLCVNCAEKMN